MKYSILLAGASILALNRDRSGGGFSRLGDPRVVTVRLDADF